MRSLRRRRSLIGSVVMMLLSTGCGIHSHNILPADAPRELARQSLSEYVIAPPDILKIDALQAIPLPPYKIQSLDVLAIRASKVLPDEPILGLYTVEPDGTVNFGLTYGSVKLAGLTLDEAKKEIEKKLLKIGLKEPQVDLSVAQGRGVQQIRGEHLVRPDGSVSLGIYGTVRVAGLTLTNAKLAIETHLKKFLQNPEVVVDMLAYNSQVFYVIFDQGGAGQRIFRLPVTGGDTVLDAISQVSGLSPVSDEHKIWLARPAEGEADDEVLPVDWKGITARGRADTNYQMMPGDRLFVKADPWITVDTKLSRVLAPFERLAGFSLLLNSANQAVKFKNTTGTNTVP